ncbi:hypothetical protein [Flavobacterium sp. GSB-24]|uniref:hypothetical protein n=1 Tax=Flavobacterium sp. GSB-24 TaxID=2994319 RepID=UPI0024924C59|nr:hypothetical protein [Flavobacterium sp. GSB-24]BDU26518.1 hypothetical protein FLGSB24_32620 [Flavobacterium sp. GSB-24]
MTQKLLYIFSVFICFNANSQNIDNIQIVEENSLSTQLYVKCFENLNQGSEIFEKYPSLKSIKFCTLLDCMFLYAYKEDDIQLAAEKRLIGITTQLYNEGTPVYLTMGLDSYLYAQEKNKNLENDNHIVYINYGECTNPDFLIKAAEIVNTQTNLLIKQSSSK